LGVGLLRRDLLALLERARRVPLGELRKIRANQLAVAGSVLARSKCAPGRVPLCHGCSSGPVKKAGRCIPLNRGFGGKILILPGGRGGFRSGPAALVLVS